MKQRIRSMSVVVLASLAMGAMATTAALAQDGYPPAPDFGFTCETAATADEPVVCSVVGAQDGEGLMVSASASPAFYTENLTANSEGQAGFSFTIPPEVGDRTVTVTVVGELSGELSTEIEPTEARTGEPVADEGRLARTGQDTILLGAAGLVLLTGGVLAIRRRKVGADAHVDA